MPTKLLPKFRNLLQKTKSNSEESRNSAVSGSTLNFIQGMDGSDSTFADKFVDIKVYRFVIFLLTLLYALFLGVNFFLQPSLETSGQELLSAYSKVSSVEDKEEFLTDINDKINIYKSLTPVRSSFNQSIQSITSTGGLSIEILQYSVDRKTFSVFAVGDGPRAFAGLIGLYLEQDAIDKIVLESASMNSTDSTISVSLRGTFR